MILTVSSISTDVASLFSNPAYGGIASGGVQSCSSGFLLYWEHDFGECHSLYPNYVVCGFRFLGGEKHHGQVGI